MFNEKKEEWSIKRQANVPVIQSPKYLQSRAKAIDAMEHMPYLKEPDFWILMNETKSGKMMYSGLIISHNACLKINDNAPEDRKFKPGNVVVNQSGFGNSLVFTYINETQGIYEVGEVNKENCKNAYPYAMGFKRLFDRVVLKLCKLAFDGILSDSEADEGTDAEPPQEAPITPEDSQATPKDPATKEMAERLTEQAFCQQELRGRCQKTGWKEEQCWPVIEQAIGKHRSDFTTEDWKNARKVVSGLK